MLPATAGVPALVGLSVVATAAAAAGAVLWGRLRHQRMWRKFLSSPSGIAYTTLDPWVVSSANAHVIRTTLARTAVASAFLTFATFASYALYPRVYFSGYIEEMDRRRWTPREGTRSDELKVPTYEGLLVYHTTSSVWLALSQLVALLQAPFIIVPNVLVLLAAAVVLRDSPAYRRLEQKGLIPTDDYDATHPPTATTTIPRIPGSGIPTSNPASQAPLGRFVTTSGGSVYHPPATGAGTQRRAGGYQRGGDGGAGDADAMADEFDFSDDLKERRV